MGDDDDRARRVAQERLERLARRDVEVVGRLVEQQQVGGLEAQQRQLQARPLAAGQLLDRLEDVLAAEQEARQVRARRALVHAAAVVSASRTVAPGMGCLRIWAR